MFKRLRKLVLFASGTCALMCLVACERTTIETNLLGRWEKVSGQSRPNSRMRTYNPGEITLDYQNGGRLIAVWDEEPHYYEWRVEKDGAVLKVDEEGDTRRFKYTFNEDGTILIVEIKTGIRQIYRRIQ